MTSGNSTSSLSINMPIEAIKHAPLYTKTPKITPKLMTILNFEHFPHLSTSFPTQTHLLLAFWQVPWAALSLEDDTSLGGLWAARRPGESRILNKKWGHMAEESPGTPKTTDIFLFFEWMFGEPPYFFHVKIWNHQVETSILKWMLRLYKIGIVFSLFPESQLIGVK